MWPPRRPLPVTCRQLTPPPNLHHKHQVGTDTEDSSWRVYIQLTPVLPVSANQDSLSQVSHLWSDLSGSSLQSLRDPLQPNETIWGFYFDIHSPVASFFHFLFWIQMCFDFEEPLTVLPLNAKRRISSERCVSAPYRQKLSSGGSVFWYLCLSLSVTCWPGVYRQTESGQ